MKIGWRLAIITLAMYVYMVASVEPASREVENFEYSIDCADGAKLSKVGDPRVDGQPYVENDVLFGESDSSSLKLGSLYLGDGYTGIGEACAFAQPGARATTASGWHSHWLPMIYDWRVFTPVRGTAAINVLRDCSPLPTCFPGCFTGNNKKCVFRIWHQKTKRIYFMKYCRYLEQISCITKCANGEMASKYASFNAVNQLQEIEFKCSSCPVGTFNTCVFSTTCTWTIPPKGSALVGTEVQQISPPAVDHCHSCVLAKSFRYHYIESPDKKLNVTINTDLDVWCEGGKNPPRNCPSAAYIHKPDYSDCICKDGYYDPDGKGGAECKSCPAGSYCVNGERILCPLHTYQDKEGQTECENCATTQDQNGIYSNCPDKQQLSWCEEGKSTRIQDNCVPCAMCKRPYVTGGTGQVNCYRSN